MREKDTEAVFNTAHCVPSFGAGLPDVYAFTALSGVTTQYTSGWVYVGIIMLKLVGPQFLTRGDYAGFLSKAHLFLSLAACIGIVQSITTYCMRDALAYTWASNMCDEQYPRISTRILG